MVFCQGLEQAQRCEALFHLPFGADDEHRATRLQVLEHHLFQGQRR